MCSGNIKMWVIYPGAFHNSFLDFKSIQTPNILTSLNHLVPLNSSTALLMESTTNSYVMGKSSHSFITFKRYAVIITKASFLHLKITFLGHC